MQNNKLGIRKRLIFILAGIFAQVAKSMGAVEATVNLGLTVIPSNILVAGIFVISAFIAISLGTSMGTIAAVAPIAVEISAKTGIDFGVPRDCCGYVRSISQNWRGNYDRRYHLFAGA